MAVQYSCIRCDLSLAPVRLLRLAQDWGFITYEMLEPLTSPEIDHIDSINATGCEESKIKQVRESSINSSKCLQLHKGF
jgi:hypothetical protein